MSLPHKNIAVREKVIDRIFNSLTEEDIILFFKNNNVKETDYKDVLCAAIHRYVHLGEYSFYVEEMSYLVHLKNNKQ